MADNMTDRSKEPNYTVFLVRHSGACREPERSIRTPPLHSETIRRIAVKVR